MPLVIPTGIPVFLSLGTLADMFNTLSITFSWWVFHTLICQVFLQSCNSFFDSQPGTAIAAVLVNLGNDRSGMEFLFWCLIMVNGFVGALSLAPQLRPIWLGYTFRWYTSRIMLNLNRTHKTHHHPPTIVTRGYPHGGVHNNTCCDWDFTKDKPEKER